MKHVLTHWNDVISLLRKRSIILLLDYDGTLTPIVAHPSLAKLSRRARRVLKNIASFKRVQIAIVSGRSLKEIKDLIGIPGLIYVGNHGLEFEGPKIRYVHPQALEARPLLGKIAGELETSMSGIPGIFVENKIFTVSVHYRQVARGKVKQAKTIFSRVLEKYIDQSKVTLTEGKKVWEVRPRVRWNKGTMVLWLFARLLAQRGKKVCPVYIGDDQTDEDAFKAIAKNGIGIKVTPAPEKTTHARYYVRSPKEVLDFLEKLKALKGLEEEIHDRRPAS